MARAPAAGVISPDTIREACVRAIAFNAFGGIGWRTLQGELQPVTLSQLHANRRDPKGRAVLSLCNCRIVAQIWSALVT
jgi:hypothetical protein